MYKAKTLAGQLIEETGRYDWALIDFEQRTRRFKQFGDKIKRKYLKEVNNKTCWCIATLDEYDCDAIKVKNCKCYGLDSILSHWHCKDCGGFRKESII